MLVSVRTNSAHPSSSASISSSPKNQGRGMMSCCHSPATGQHVALPQQHPRANQTPVSPPNPTPHLPKPCCLQKHWVEWEGEISSRSGQDIISPKERSGGISALSRLAQQIRSNICGWTPSSGNHSTRHGASAPPATHGDPSQGIKPFSHRYCDYYCYFHSLTIYMLCRCCWTSTPTAQHFLMEILQKWGWNG